MNHFSTIGTICLFCCFYCGLAGAQTIEANAAEKLKTIEWQLQNQAKKLHQLDSIQTEVVKQHEMTLKMADGNIQHSQSLLQVSENQLGFASLVLGLFGAVVAFAGFFGVREIRRITTVRQEMTDELARLRESQELAQQELEAFKASSAKDGKELLQILFCLSEGDRDQEANKLDEAINWYKQALQIRADDPEVYAKLGYGYSRIGEYGYAIKYLEDGYQIDPRNVTILNSLARAYRKSGQYDKAEELYQQALDIDDEFFWALSGMAIVKTHFRQYREAEKLIHHCLLKEDSHHSHVNLGVVYLGLGNDQKANEHFQRAITIIEKRFARSHENHWLFARKAVALIGLKKYDEAMLVLNKLMSQWVYAEVIRSIQERLVFFKTLRSESEILPFEEVILRNSLENGPPAPPSEAPGIV